MNTNKLLYYLPRIIGILAIVLISSFALDVFTEGEALPNVLIGLLIHLIPSFVLTILLTFAWKFERLGGVLFIFISLVPFLILDNVWWVNVLLVLPFFLTGVLFILHDRHTVRTKNINL